MKKFWIIPIFGVVLLAIFITFTPGSQNLSGIAIEIFGAFLGVFAAVALGEIVKDYRDHRIGVRVRENLTTELKSIYNLLQRKPNEVQVLNILFWETALAAGDLAKLDLNLFLHFNVAYNRIGGHNELVKQLENYYNHPRVTEAKKAEYSVLLRSSNARVSRDLQNILESLKHKKPIDLTQFLH